MTITVEKSENLKLDKNSTDALAEILATLEKQTDLVKNVQVLSNFSLDHDATLLFNRPIVKGLVVVVDKEYKLSEDDMSWFHPSIARGRSLFNIANPIPREQLMNVSGINNSVGEYTINSQDDFGCDSLQHRLVVDASIDESLYPLYKKWIQQGSTAGEVDKQWKRMKFNEVNSINEYSKKMRCEIALSIDPAAEHIMSDTTNNVLSDTTHVYFFNDAVKNTTNVLVKTSALGGYCMYKSLKTDQRFISTSMGNGNTLYSWDRMTPQNIQRIETTCSWDGDVKFNTQVMRPPLQTDVRSFEQEYSVVQESVLRMRLAKFSKSDDIIDKMAPRDVFNVSPGSEHTTNGLNTISSPVNMDHIVLQRLMEKLGEVQDKFQDFHLFNTKAVQGGRLILPREIYDYLA